MGDRKTSRELAQFRPRVSDARSRIIRYDLDLVAESRGAHHIGGAESLWTLLALEFDRLTLV